MLINQVEWKKKKHSADLLRINQSVPNDLFSIPVLDSSADEMRKQQKSKSPCRNTNRKSRLGPSKMRQSSAADNVNDYRKMLYFETSPALSSRSGNRNHSPHSQEKRITGASNSKNLRGQIDKHFHNEMDFFENYADQKENLQPLAQNESIVIRDSSTSPPKKQQRSALRQLADITASYSDHKKNSNSQRRSLNLILAAEGESKTMPDFHEDIAPINLNQNWLTEQYAGPRPDTLEVSLEMGKPEKTNFNFENAVLERGSRGQIASRNSIRSERTPLEENKLELPEKAEVETQFEKRNSSRRSLTQGGSLENVSDIAAKNMLNDPFVFQGHFGFLLPATCESEQASEQVELVENPKRLKRLNLTHISSHSQGSNMSYSVDLVKTSHSPHEYSESNRQAEVINQDPTAVAEEPSENQKLMDDEPVSSKPQLLLNGFVFPQNERFRAKSMQNHSLDDHSASLDTVSNSAIIEVNLSMAIKELPALDIKHQGQKSLANISAETNNTKNDCSVEMQNNSSDLKHQNEEANSFSFRKENLTPSKLTVNKEVMTESKSIETSKMPQDRQVEDKGIQTDFADVSVSIRPDASGMIGHQILSVEYSQRLSEKTEKFDEEEIYQQKEVEPLKAEILTSSAEKGKPPRAPMRKRSNGKSEITSQTTIAEDNSVSKQELDKDGDEKESQSFLEPQSDLQMQEEERIVEQNDSIDLRPVFKPQPIQCTKSAINKFLHEPKSIALPYSFGSQPNSKIPNNSAECIKSRGSNDEIISVSVRVYTPKGSKENSMRNSPANLEEKPKEGANVSQFIQDPVAFEPLNNFDSNPHSNQLEIPSVELYSSNLHLNAITSPLNTLQERKTSFYLSQGTTPIGIHSDLPKQMPSSYYLSKRDRSLRRDANTTYAQPESPKTSKEVAQSGEMIPIHLQFEGERAFSTNTQNETSHIRNSQMLPMKKTNNDSDFQSPQFFQESNRKLSEILSSEFNLQTAHQALDIALNRSRRTLSQYSRPSAKQSDLSVTSDSVIRPLDPTRFQLLDPSNRSSLLEVEKFGETRHFADTKQRGDLPLFNSYSQQELPPPHLKKDSPRERTTHRSPNNISPSKQPNIHSLSQQVIEPNPITSRNNEQSMMPSPVKRIDPSGDCYTDRLGISALNLLHNKFQDSPFQGSLQALDEKENTCQERQTDRELNPQELITPLPKEKMLINNFSLAQSAQHFEFEAKVPAGEGFSSRREDRASPNQKSVSEKSAIRFTKEQLLSAIPCSSVNGDERSEISCFQVERRNWAGKINEESGFTDSRLDSANRFHEEYAFKFTPRTQSPTPEVKINRIYEELPRQNLHLGGQISNPQSYRDYDESSVVRFDPSSTGKLANFQDDEERCGSYNSKNQNQIEIIEQEVIGTDQLDVDKFRKYFQRGLSKIEETVDEGTIGKSLETLHFIDQKTFSPPREASEEGENLLSVRVGAALSGMTHTMKDVNQAQDSRMERLTSMHLDTCPDDSRESKWVRSSSRRPRLMSDLDMPSDSLAQLVRTLPNTTRPVSAESNFEIVIHSINLLLIRK